MRPAAGRGVGDARARFGMFSACALLACALSAAGSPAAPARAQSLDPAAYRSGVAGEPTRVLVLGTVHLSGLPDDWDSAVLDPLLDRLTAFDPDVVTMEDLPGPLIHELWAYRETYPEVALSFARRAMEMADAARLSTGMDMPQAQAAADRALEDWPEDPDPARRRELAALFAAAGDPYSALVQWLRLPDGERVRGDGVSETLAGQLGELAANRNESSLISARLAARLGLERIFPTDQQDERTLSPSQSDVFYEEVWPDLIARFEADPRMREYDAKRRGMTDGQRILAAYRFLNDAAVGERQAEIEWRDVIARPSADDVARRRMAGWEVRNLRMAANIREASSHAPGGRVLVVVGAAHKQWLEAYLGMMTDIEIVSADDILH